jgi:DNA-binding NtrC family response regulator
MVIDDSNTIRRSAEIFLMQAGCQVILARSPKLPIISRMSFLSTS